MLACTAERFDALAMVKPQFEVGRDRVGKGGVVRGAGDRRAALVAVARAAQGLGAAVLGFASSGLPGPKGNRETFVWLAEGGARGRGRRPRGGRRGGRAGVTTRTRAVTVLSHTRTGAGAPPRSRRSCARPPARGSRCASTPTRRASTVSPPGTGFELDAPLADDVELCVVLGGDGTILRALRHYAGTSVPVFAVNYGEVGFLATIDPEPDGDLEPGLRARRWPATSRS